MPRDVKSFLRGKKDEAKDEEVSRHWFELDELYSKRLWHQLTLKIQAFSRHQFFNSSGLLEMYECFIKEFEHKINPLSLVDIAVVTSKEIQEPKSKAEFLKNIKEKVKNDPEAHIFCMTSLGSILLQQNLLDEVKVLLDEICQLLESLSGVSLVHARFYELSSSYNEARSNFEAYYRDALRYLGCIDIASIPASEQSERAFRLGLAALLAGNVYNFGEILSHSVMDALRGTQRTWMEKLLKAFNAGDLGRFEELRPYWEQQPDLFKNQDMLLLKIRLLSVMELIFRRDAHDRIISFSEIAKGANIDTTEVEPLIMKALSLGLIKGYIDQVLQEATLTWVQPRVLSKEQVEVLHRRITGWTKDVKGIVDLMKIETPEVAIHL